MNCRDRDADRHRCLHSARFVAAQRNRGGVRDVRCPDEEVRSAEAMGLICRDDVGPIAVEHTEVEA